MREAEGIHIFHLSSLTWKEFFDILWHKTVSNVDFKLVKMKETEFCVISFTWTKISITAESMSDSHLWELGESKLGRLVDALALGGDEGRDKLR